MAGNFWANMEEASSMFGEHEVNAKAKGKWLESVHLPDDGASTILQIMARVQDWPTALETQMRKWAEEPPEPRTPDECLDMLVAGYEYYVRHCEEYPTKVWKTGIYNASTEDVRLWKRENDAAIGALSLRKTSPEFLNAVEVEVQDSVDAIQGAIGEARNALSEIGDDVWNRRYSGTVCTKCYRAYIERFFPSAKAWTDYYKSDEYFDKLGDKKRWVSRSEPEFATVYQLIDDIKKLEQDFGNLCSDPDNCEIAGVLSELFKESAKQRDDPFRTFGTALERARWTPDQVWPGGD